ncbi:MAG: amidohydrolase [Gemmatimonadota bacterium]|nr:amidohydrolase [Gemmatimonadota bacterium]
MIDRPRNSRLRATIGVTAALLTLSCGGGPPDEAASLILLGGNVITMDAANPRAEAVAVAGDRIVYVGGSRGVEAWRGPGTRVVDLAGATVLPGLTDAHAHLMGTGRLKARVDVLETTSFQEVLDAVATAVAGAEPGAWIIGRGWHQEKWTDKPQPSVRGFPVNDALTAISPNNPVAIRHASGHGRLANALALEAAGITADTPDPPGGEILHRPDGRPSGMLLENAEDLVHEAYQAWLDARSPAERMADERQALRLGIEEFLRNGITQVHTAPSDEHRGADEEEVFLYRAALEAGELKLRVWTMLDGRYATDELLARLRTIGEGGNRLTVRALKGYADGALGSRGAMLLEPYTDDPTMGEERLTRQRLEEIVELALRHDYQAAIHAIGDGANRRVLDIYEQAFARHEVDGRDLRFRVEHAQIVHPDDVGRFGEMGVTAAMQGVHATSDGPWTATRLGAERTSEEAFPFRPLQESGALIVNGTDSPVERVAPFASIAGMAVGLMNNGQVFNPHHLLTREQALATYTINPAIAAFEQELRGSIVVGKLADFTITEEDPLTVPDERLADTRVLMTIVGGEIVYSSEGL